MLHSPEAHEPLAGDAWDPDRVRAAIAEIVADTEDAFDDGWPTHPEDVEEPWEATKRFRAVYLGGAGVVDALDRLARRGVVELGRDYVPYVERSAAEPPDFRDESPARGFLSGETGIRFVLQRLSPSAENLARLAELIAENARDERLELLWGSPGTILVGKALGLDVSESVDWLRAQRDADGLWTQDLFGRRHRVLGAAHGFAGCALALGTDDASEALRPFAVEENGFVNWPGVAGHELTRNRDGLIRTQWCHGAPGIVATLGALLDEDLALAGAELTWAAGPVRKGASLCHGTAGNGYAFLALLARTGDERWLERARAFAMHALVQVERARREHGRGRYTLWTGDPGTALYLADCIDGGGRLPLP